jgi:hypothetical protein
MNGDWKPTGKLRFVERRDADGVTRILQQFIAPDVPSYLMNDREGKWVDVPVETEE